MTEILVRPAEVNDAPQLPALLLQLGYEIESDALARNFEAFSEIKGHHAFVAVARGTVLGFISLHISYWFHRPDPPARISALVVGEEHRGLGVGRKLVDHAESTAREAGCELVELTAAAYRREIGTHDFYKAMGFVDSSDASTLFRKSLVS